MTRVTYTGPAAVWRTAAYGGVTVSSGETIDVDESTAESLVANQDFERAEDMDESDGPGDPEYGILTESVSDLEAEVDAGEHDDHLADLKRDEEEHKNRSTAKEAIDERRREVADAKGKTEAEVDVGEDS